MARNTAAWRLVSVAGAASLILTACSLGGEDPGASDSGIVTDTVVQSDRDDKLDFGFIYPETGALAALGVPQLTAFELAIQDINDAGGVNGEDVTAEIADEGSESAQVRSAAASHVNAGADVVVGAAASGLSQDIIQLLHDNRIVQCSGSNTSPTFTEQDNNTYYFRTVPPDAAVAPVIADAIVDDGARDIAVVSRADDYGIALGDLVQERIEENEEAQVTFRTDYQPDAEDFSDVVARIVDEDVDAIALIAFGEGATLIGQAIEEGIDADQFYGSDGLFDPQLSEAVGANIAGLKVYAAAGDTDFNERLDGVLPSEHQGNYIYGGQVYDCAIVSALAAIAADSVDPAVFYEAVPGVTQDGTECTSFADCKELLEAGEDIDYNGVSGAIDLNHPDPRFGKYAVGQYNEDGALRVIDDHDVDLTELSDNGDEGDSED